METSYYKKVRKFIKKFNVIFMVFAPTYAIYSCLKSKMPDRNDRYILSNDIKKFFLALSINTLAWIFMIDLVYEHNWINQLCLWLCFSISIFVSIVFLFNVKNNFSNRKISKVTSIICEIILFVFCALPIIAGCSILFKAPINYKYIIEKYIFSNIICGFIIYILAISRPLHFFLVFIPDILKKIEKGEKRTGVGKARLLLIAVGSYINILIDYTILYYFLNKIGKHFSGFSDILDILYKTSGCGDLNPSSMIAKILIIIQSASITILIAGNLAIYINMNTKQKNKICRKNF
ncbi:MAG: hypothetical protein E7E58_08995 [Paeniclostridium sordellii]|nr:hypothetical protein [Paeniclostridium sordellii]